VNNAGRGYYAAVENIDARELEEIFRLNVIAPLRLAQLALPALRRSRGAVVMMSSVAGVVSSPKLGGYSASKFALEAIAVALRAEIASAGVAVIVVRPGPVDTPFHANSVAKDTSPGVRPPGSSKQSAELIAEYTLSAIAKRKPVVETSAFVRVASFGSRVVPPVFRAVVRRMKT
jgi:short-subunit dehydrogenase